MTKICYEVADINGIWFPDGGPECDSEIIPIPSFDIWGLGVSLPDEDKVHVSYNVFANGAWVGELKDGNKLMAPGPITALIIQFGPRGSAEVTIRVWDRNRKRLPDKHDNEVVGDTAAGAQPLVNIKLW